MTSPDDTGTAATDRVGYRVVGAGIAGAAAAALTGVEGGWRDAPVVGWLAGATVFLLWTWYVVARLNPAQTAAHATREDPTRAISHALLGIASLASLMAVGYLLAVRTADGRSTDALVAALSLTSVGASWCTVNTLFTLRYARLYYASRHGDIDFNQKPPPAYADFAYLGFTIGMTYQVSDTQLTSPAIRASVLRHALLSYVLGAIVLATTVNLVAGLGGH